MVKQPLVSVVIPTYNRGYCLQRCLDSVLSQSYQKTEVVLIDDGSEDDTEELVKRLFHSDSRIRYVYQRNQGVSVARNHGLRLARGEFVALLDSDDVWIPWKLELQLAVMAHLPEVGMVWTDMEAVDQTGTVCDPKYLRRMYHAYRWFPDSASLFSGSCALSSIAPNLSVLIGDVLVSFGDIFSPLIMGNLVHTSTVLIRKNRLAQVGGFQERFRYTGEDYDFHLRTCREGPVAFVDVASIKYQIGGEDRLTRPQYNAFMAVHSLITIRPFLKNERSRISLPQSLLNTMLGESYTWLGESLLDRGKQVASRRFLCRALRYQPLRPRLMGLCMLSFLRPESRHWYLAVYRSFKRLGTSFARRMSLRRGQKCADPPQGK